MNENQHDALLVLVDTSNLVDYEWKDRGKAPTGYYRGMAFCFARMYCRWKAGDEVALEIAKADTGDAAHDALTHYRDQFADLSMDNNASGTSTLRHVYALMLGLGMRESSGKHCEGRDANADNREDDTAEAGLFQVSYNLRHAAPVFLQKIEDSYTGRTDFANLFGVGVTCSPGDWQSWGEGRGAAFQVLTKKCPAFAVEYAAVGLRSRRSHWGPVNHHKAELLATGDAFFQSVQAFVDSERIVSV